MPLDLAKRGHDFPVLAEQQHLSLARGWRRGLLSTEGFLHSQLLSSKVPLPDFKVALAQLAQQSWQEAEAGDSWDIGVPKPSPNSRFKTLNPKP